jgi:mersacidin/lichenicidin family type 2 lantibiotic
MRKIDIARAWRDEEYYLSLTAAERAALPANPAAAMTVTDEELGAINGGIPTSVAASCFATSICTPCPHMHCI